MSEKFDEWWDENKDGFPATPLMKQCFDGGYDKGYADGVAAVKVLRFALMGVIALAVVFVLAGCEDQYRYACQNPDKFNAPQCQKPKCQFTQTCPEYLVAPVLKDQINAQPTQASPEAAPNR